MRSTIMAMMRYVHVTHHACEALRLTLLQHMLQLCKLVAFEVQVGAAAAAAKTLAGGK